MNDLDALAAEIRRRIEAKKTAEKPKVKPDDQRENPTPRKKPRPKADHRRKV